VKKSSAPRRTPRAKAAPAPNNIEIIVNCASRETRIAVLENQKLMEYRVEREERVVGSIFKGIVQNVLPGMDAAFVDIGLERNAFLYVADILPDDASDGSPASIRRSELRRRKIKELIKPGQELMVQVTKGPRGTKGARVTTRISLPGRYVVLMPEGNHLGVSRTGCARSARS
jgi:ribonuclease G